MHSVWSQQLLRKQPGMRDSIPLDVRWDTWDTCGCGSLGRRHKPVSSHMKSTIVALACLKEKVQYLSVDQLSTALACLINCLWRGAED